MKLAGELAIQEDADNYISLRTSRVFSKDGKNFVNTILQLAKERDELKSSMISLAFQPVLTVLQRCCFSLQLSIKTNGASITTQDSPLSVGMSLPRKLWNRV